MFQPRNDVLRVGFYAAFQGIETHALPRSRYILMLRIGPGIGKMEIQEKKRSGVLDSLCQGNCILQRIVRGSPHRRKEDAQSKGLPAMVREDSQLVACFPVFPVN